LKAPKMASGARQGVPQQSEALRMQGSDRSRRTTRIRSRFRFISGGAYFTRSIGSLPLEQLFARAIEFTPKRRICEPRVAMDWPQMRILFAGDEHAASVLPGGKAPKSGRHASPTPNWPNVCADIAKNGAAGFYEGGVALKWPAHLQSLGGLHTPKRIFTKVGIKATGLKPFHRGYGDHDVS